LNAGVVELKRGLKLVVFVELVVFVLIPNVKLISLELKNEGKVV
jgi:hypothetical protein